MFARGPEKRDKQYGAGKADLRGAHLRDVGGHAAADDDGDDALWQESE